MISREDVGTRERVAGLRVALCGLMGFDLRGDK